MSQKQLAFYSEGEGGGIIVTKKNLLIAVLTTLCLSSVLFTTLPIRSATEPWDQWADVSGPTVGEQDGTVNLRDIQYLIFKFNTHGPPYVDRTLINATQSQIDSLNLRIDELNSSLDDLRFEVEGLNVTNLMPLIDSLNASLIGLRSDVTNMNFTVMSEISMLNASVTALSSRINSLETQMNTMNATIAGMNTIVTQLQNSNADLNNRASALESNYSNLLGRIVTLEEKTAHPLSFNQTRSTYAATTTSVWTDVVNLATSITIEENSTLIIMFSVEAYNTLDSWTSENTYVRALVDGNVVVPSEILLTPHIGETGWFGLSSHHHLLGPGAYSYNSYATVISPGNHIVKMQFRVDGGTTEFWDSTLVVIALPT